MPIGYPAEEYEYACLPTFVAGCGCACGGRKDNGTEDLEWGSQNSAEWFMFEAVKTEAGRRIRENTPYSYEFRVVKRRKAGRVEEL